MKPRTKICKTCSAKNKKTLFKCHVCGSRFEKRLPQPKKWFALAPRRRGLLICDLATLCLFIVAARAIYKQSIQLPYRIQRKTQWYEFNGLEIAAPLSAMFMLAVLMMTFSIIIGDQGKHFNSKPFDRVLIFSFVTTPLLYFSASFFGHPVR